MAVRRQNVFTLAALLIVYTIAAVWLIKQCSHDPTSVFFDYTIAYQAVYSSQREKEALLFKQQLDTGHIFRNSNDAAFNLCVGIPTVHRAQRYLESEIGSLFDGVSAQHREEITLQVLIAHTDPHRHYVYQQPWLERVADDIIHYNTSHSDYSMIRKLESEDDHWVQGIRDY